MLKNNAVVATVMSNLGLKKFANNNDIRFEETKVGEYMHGFTDNYVRVELPYDLSLDNKLVRVRMGDFNEDGTSLKGEIIS